MSETEVDELVAAAWRDARMSTAVIAVLLAGALFAAFVIGKVGPGLPKDWGKIWSAVGLTVAGWGTYYGLHGIPHASWYGTRRDEVLRRRFVAFTVPPGIFFAVVGILLS